MLLDEKVVDFINKHFVPVITDHPQGSTEPKRNPEMWERSEKWKEKPNNSQLVWLVSADESKRDGIYYHKFEEPEELLEWMNAIIKKDLEQ